MEKSRFSSEQAGERQVGPAVLTIFEQAAKRLLALTAVPAYLVLLASLFSEATNSSIAITLTLTLLAALIIIVVITLLSEKVYAYRQTGIRFSLSTAFLISIPLCIYLAAIQQVLKRSPMDDDPVVWIVGAVVSIWWMAITTVALLWFAEAVMTLAVGVRRAWRVPTAALPHRSSRSPAVETPGRNSEFSEIDDSRTVRIHDYRSAWAGEFVLLRCGLQETLGSLAIRIDHIGATSVPGLAARDVIDVQVTVREFTPEVTDRLTLAGYQDCIATARGDISAGAGNDQASWENHVFVPPNGRSRARVYVRIAGQPDQRRPLLLRDYLRAHPNSVQTVGLIKREIARRFPEDVASYFAIRNPIFDLLWEAAQTWAVSSGWNP